MHDAIIRLRARLARSWLTGLCLSLYCFADCFASVDVCQEPPTYSHLSVGYYNHEKSSIGNTLTETNPENYDFDLLFKSSKWGVLELEHKYGLIGEESTIDPRAATIKEPLPTRSGNGKGHTEALLTAVVEEAAD